METTATAEKKLKILASADNEAFARALFTGLLTFHLVKDSGCQLVEYSTVDESQLSYVSKYNKPKWVVVMPDSDYWNRFTTTFEKIYDYVHTFTEGWRAFEKLDKARLEAEMIAKEAAEEKRAAKARPVTGDFVRVMEELEYMSGRKTGQKYTQLHPATYRVLETESYGESLIRECDPYSAEGFRGGANWVKTKTLKKTKPVKPLYGVNARRDGW